MNSITASIIAAAGRIADLLYPIHPAAGRTTNNTTNTTTNTTSTNDVLLLIIGVIL